MSAGQGLVSKGIIIDGSLCLGMSCEHTAELNGVQNWCLMFINIDSDLITANIRFQYEGPDKAPLSIRIDPLWCSLLGE